MIFPPPYPTNIWDAYKAVEAIMGEGFAKNLQELVDEHVSQVVYENEMGDDL